MAMQTTTALSHPSQLGEGSIWDPETNRLYWVDILSSEVHIFDPKTGKDQAINVGSHVGTVVKRKSGGLMLSVQHGFAWLDLETKRTSMIAEVEPENAAKRFNDGKCDPAGRFWAGTMAYKFDKGAGFLYRLDVDHSVHQMVDGITCSNGIVWTSDKKRMYYIDTPTGRVDAFDYDNETGAIMNRRTAVEVAKGAGSPDGMAIDAEDNVWVAMWGGCQVVKYDPRTGKELDSVKVPGAKNITSCALGGPKLTDMYITSAAMESEEEKKQYPESGSVFHASVKTPGVAAVEYAG